MAGDLTELTIVDAFAALCRNHWNHAISLSILHTCNNLRTDEQIFIKFDISKFCQNLSVNFSFKNNGTKKK
jgi:hypothetical protein